MWKRRVTPRFIPSHPVPSFLATLRYARRQKRSGTEWHGVNERQGKGRSIPHFSLWTALSTPYASHSRLIVPSPVARSLFTLPCRSAGIRWERETVSRWGDKMITVSIRRWAGWTVPCHFIPLHSSPLIRGHSLSYRSLPAPKGMRKGPGDTTAAAPLSSPLFVRLVPRVAALA